MIHRNKQIYIRELEERFSELERQIHMVESRIQEAGEFARAEYDAQIRYLRREQQQIARRLERLGNSPDEEDSHSRNDIENAWQSLKNAISQTLANFQ